jgi:hypothetical protein
VEDPVAGRAKSVRQSGPRSKFSRSAHPRNPLNRHTHGTPRPTHPRHSTTPGTRAVITGHQVDHDRARQPHLPSGESHGRLGTNRSRPGRNRPSHVPEPTPPRHQFDHASGEKPRLPDTNAATTSAPIRSRLGRETAPPGHQCRHHLGTNSIAPRARNRASRTPMPPPPRQHRSRLRHENRTFPAARATAVRLESHDYQRPKPWPATRNSPTVRAGRNDDRRSGRHHRLGTERPSEREPPSPRGRKTARASATIATGPNNLLIRSRARRSRNRFESKVRQPEQHQRVVVPHAMAVPSQQSPVQACLPRAMPRRQRPDRRTSGHDVADVHCRQHRLIAGSDTPVRNHHDTLAKQGPRIRDRSRTRREHGRTLRRGEVHPSMPGQPPLCGRVEPSQDLWRSASGAADRPLPYAEAQPLVQPVPCRRLRRFVSPRTTCRRRTGEVVERRGRDPNRANREKQGEHGDDLHASSIAEFAILQEGLSARLWITRESVNIGAQ